VISTWLDRAREIPRPEEDVIIDVLDETWHVPSVLERDRTFDQRCLVSDVYRFFAMPRGQVGKATLG
jgi:hypothetical protein